MPPPRPISAVERARAELLEEPLPPRYFGSASVGTPSSAFGTWITPQYAANLRLQDEENLLKRDTTRTRLEENFQRRRLLPDETDTALAQNALNRAQYGSETRMLPHSEAAKIAGLRLQQAQAEATGRNLPFQEESQREGYMTQADQHRATREVLPYATQAELDEYRSADPYFARLAKLTNNDSEAAAAYESFSRAAPKTLTPQGRQQFAFDATTRLLRDREAVEAIDAADAVARTTANRDELLEDVLDPESGQYLGSRLKPGVDMKKVHAAVRQHRNAKRTMAMDKEARIKDAEDMRGLIGIYKNAVDSLDGQIKTLQSKSMDGKGNTEDQPQLAELQRQRAEYQQKLLAIAGHLDRWTVKPAAEQSKAAPAPTPAKPAAPPKKGKLFESYYGAALKAAQGG